MQEINHEMQYLLRLLRCALNDEPAAEKPETVSWNGVWTLAQEHGVSMLAYHALRELPSFRRWRGAALWGEKNAELLVKAINQQCAFAQLKMELDRAKIACIALKGCCLRALYPEAELREMTDIDLLIEEASAERADKIMLAAGYHVTPSAEHHAEYLLPPYLVMELHTSLMPKDSSQYAYYADPWRRAKRCADGFCFSCEDTYLFLLSHAAKHYDYQGLGIRPVMDVYVYLRRYGAKLDRQYLARELEELKLTEFAKAIETLAMTWFSAQTRPLSAEAQKLSYYILCGANGGARGADERFVRQELERGKSPRAARMHLFLSKAFLSAEEMKWSYPALEKAPILLPFFWLVRWGRILICKPRSIIWQYRSAKSVRCYHSENPDRKK